jgi:hypothetical protein
MDSSGVEVLFGAAHRVYFDTPCMKARRESSGFFLCLPPSAAIAFLVLGVWPAVDVCGVLSGVTAFSFSCAFAFDFAFRTSQ